MMLTEAYDQYEHYLEGLERSQRTVTGYRQDLVFFNRWLEEQHNGPVLLEDLNLESVEAFLYMLKVERDYKPASRRRLAATLKMFLGYLYKRKLLETDIGSEITNIKVVNQERTYLTEKEALDFIQATDHPLCQVVLYTIFYAGLRVSECVNLMKAEVDLEKRTIQVTAGKGSKDRVIPISDKLLTILKAYEKERIDSDHYFATNRTGSISRVTIASIVKRTRTKLKITKHVTPHTFRHSFASHLVSKDVNIVSISRLLGHADIKVTSVYTHTSMDQLVKAIDQM